MERLEFVVIGAGTYGLAAAKQYQVQHPSDDIAVIDYASSLGGVWAKHRLYPNLKSNNLLGTYEYPDFPMDSAAFGVQAKQHIPGHVIHDYQEAYAKRFGIIDKLRLSTKVLSAEHMPEAGWVLRTTKIEDNGKSEGADIRELYTRRLVIATGLVSEPFMPYIEGQESFNRPLFHSKDFLQNADTIQPGNRVTVFGGTKYAWDAVYAYATNGVSVDWVIRETGHGPAWMAPPFVTPFKKWLEKLVNSGYSAIKSFWHGTTIGRMIVDAFWSILGQDAIDLMGYDKHPERKKLKPTSDAMTTGCSFSILNYDTDFMELIRSGKVRVHISDLSHLSPGKVHLADENSTVLEADAMLAVTGWKHKPPIKFLPEGIEKEIDLPYERHESDVVSYDHLGSQDDLIAQADQEIQEQFPRLKRPAKFNPKYKPLTDTKAFSDPKGQVESPMLTPTMLYHLITPAAKRFLRTKDIAFAGPCMNFSNVITAHLQGLWISAFFDGKLVRDPNSAVINNTRANSETDDAIPKDEQTDLSRERLTLEKVRYETVLHNRFGKWRYPNDPGSKHPDFVFEAVPYLDMLLADLGLKVHRKKDWWAEMSDPYGPEDYRDVNDEWQAKVGSKT